MHVNVKATLVHQLNQHRYELNRTLTEIGDTESRLGRLHGDRLLAERAAQEIESHLKEHGVDVPDRTLPGNSAPSRSVAPQACRYW